MPTGYTSDLYEGNDQTFEEFALACARAFGATITMRDDPLDKPIPDEFKPSDYNAKAIADAEWRLRNLAAVSDGSAALQAQQEYEEAHARWEEERRKKAARRQRYEAMLAHARAWQPPTADHEGLKKFMVEQLESSIDFDCSTDDRFWPEPQPKSVVEWKAEQITKAERDLAYHREEHRKEVERASGRTEWVRALRRSLTEMAEA